MLKQMAITIQGKENNTFFLNVICVRNICLKTLHLYIKYKVPIANNKMLEIKIGKG